MGQERRGDFKGGDKRCLKKNVECRFCGQFIQVESDDDMTAPQAEEAAVMLCQCYQAMEYRKEKNRREKALKNVSRLFGKDAPMGKQVSEGAAAILLEAVNGIYNGEIAKITLHLRGGVKASISQNSKGEINVERTETKKDKLTG